MEATISFPSKAAQKILELVPDLVVLDDLNFTKEQLPTDFIIHSSVNKLRDIYALHICCVFLFYNIDLLQLNTHLS